eukprot:9066879-Pyramimonas_sp.AAC.1
MCTLTVTLREVRRHVVNGESAVSSSALAVHIPAVPHPRKLPPSGGANDWSEGRLPVSNMSIIIKALPLCIN